MIEALVADLQIGASVFTPSARRRRRPHRTGAGFARRRA